MKEKILLNNYRRRGGKYPVMEVTVDESDFDWLNQWRWSVKKNRNRFYAARAAINPETGKYTEIQMHRLILCLNDPKITADHIDGDGLNNQRHNLRVATIAQNNANRKVRQSRVSKYLGVKKNNNCDTWSAQITKNYKKHYLGSFKNEAEAAMAYNEAAVRLHGEFANLNVI